MKEMRLNLELLKYLNLEIPPLAKPGQNIKTLEIRLTIGLNMKREIINYKSFLIV